MQHYVTIVFVSSAFYSIATKFPLSRHIFFWLFNTLSCKVCRSIHSMSLHSYVWLLEHLCCDTNNCVATLFLHSFFKLCSDPIFMSRHHFCWYFVATMFLVLSTFLSRPGKSVAIESCLHLTRFLVVASFLCCNIIYWFCRFFLWRPSFHVATRLFAFSQSLCRDLVLLCRDKTSFPCVGIFVARWKSLSQPCASVFSLFLCCDLNIYVATSKLLINLKYVATLNSFVATRSVH